LQNTNKQNLNLQQQGDQNRFEALFMYAAIGIIMVDQEGKIILSNRHADVIFGYNENELAGEQLGILVPQHLREGHSHTFGTYTQKPKPRAMGLGLDLHGRRKDGTQFPVEISLSHFEANHKRFFIAFINDMTFKKTAEQSLKEKNAEIQKINESLEIEVVNRTNALVETLNSLENSKKELEAALSKEKELGELKSRFVSMASHEFRTPLTTIQSAAVLIEKYSQTAEQEKRVAHLKRIKAAVGNLTDILEEFLSVGKLEEGKIERKHSTFDLVELVNETIESLKSSLKNRQHIEYKHIGSTLATTDQSLLRKILLNLTANAIKFSPENTTIFVQSNTNKQQLLLQIKDSGIGISTEDQKHLFDRFFRAKNAANIPGTGLGLHIVQQYVQLLGGNIQLESELDLGTSITITI
jgi:PAS domain S-box-containing protein